MSGGLPPNRLPAALHNGNLLPSFDQTTTFKLINAPAASGIHSSSSEKQTMQASAITSNGTSAKEGI